MEKKNVFRCKKKPSQVKYKVILDRPLKWTPKLPISIIYMEINYPFLVLLRRPTKVTSSSSSSSSSFYFSFFFSYMDRYTIQIYLCGGLGPEILNIELQCISFRISKFTHKSKIIIIH